MSSAAEQSQPTDSRAGLEDLFGYPLMACLQDRRTRRVAQGVSLMAGELSYESSNAPSPLTPLEEAILIAATGVTGAVMMDGPLDKPSGKPELGTPFLHMTGRAASSADNAQATSLFMINDEGIWLIKRPKERDAIEFLRSLPPRWDDRTEADWIAAANAVKVKVYDKRFEFPREWPYYLGWNAQHSNAPGTTCFMPVVDNTRQYINALLILSSEPRGKAPLWLDDWRKFHPKGAAEWVAWLGSKIGLVDPIPYHPVGGLKWVRNGWATPETPGPLGNAGTVRTDHEAFFLLQNLMLTGEALRLGAWVHGAPMAPHVMRRDEAKGHLGLGFREHSFKPSSSRLRRWPPVPASQPNFVGIDGVLEGLCPPYETDMDRAVDRLLEEKYGPGGAYDPEMFGQAWRDRGDVENYIRHGAQHPPEAVEYTKEICRYLVDTYGRFPAHTDAFYIPGIWVQLSHLELEYYERFAKPGHARRASEGKAIWGRT
ncbi:MAG TPA: hypothetical protein VII51_05260 [Gaiellaceae bacterium]